MTGNRQSFAERGLIPRAITAILQQLAAAPDLTSWRLEVSYLEIYNEALFDLLDLNTQPHELSLYEDGRGLTQVRVRGEEGGLDQVNGSQFQQWQFQQP
jgi:kinesin family protein 6/9